MAKDKFLPVSSMSPKINFAGVDGDDNQVAPPQMGVNFSDSFEAKFEEINQFNTITYLCNVPWEKLQGKISGRACIKVTEFSDPRSPALVNAQPKAGLPILAEIINGCLGLTTRRNPVTQEIIEWESRDVYVTYFQRLRDALGDTLEERLVLGSASMRLEQFAEEHELEVPHAVAARAMKRLSADEKAKRLKFEQAVLKLPAPVAPEDRLAAGIAAGVAAALAKLNLQPKATP